VFARRRALLPEIRTLVVATGDQEGMETQPATERIAKEISIARFRPVTRGDPP
jgi:hypothetical protein